MGELFLLFDLNIDIILLNLWGVLDFKGGEIVGKERVKNYFW